MAPVIGAPGCIEQTEGKCGCSSSKPRSASSDGLNTLITAEPGSLVRADFNVLNASEPHSSITTDVNAAGTMATDAHSYRGEIARSYRGDSLGASDTITTGPPHRYSSTSATYAVDTMVMQVRSHRREIDRSYRGDSLDCTTGPPHIFTLTQRQMRQLTRGRLKPIRTEGRLADRTEGIDRAWS